MKGIPARSAAAVLSLALSATLMAQDAPAPPDTKKPAAPAATGDAAKKPVAVEKVEKSAKKPAAAAVASSTEKTEKAPATAAKAAAEKQAKSKPEAAPENQSKSKSDVPSSSTTVSKVDKAEKAPVAKTAAEKGAKATASDKASVAAGQKPAAQAAGAAPGAAGASQAQAAAPSAPSVAVDDITLPPHGFTYNARARRDPFVTLMKKGSETESATAAGRAAGLAGLLTSEVTLRGILASQGSYVAMVHGADEKTYIVHPGDRLADGTIRTITAQALIIQQRAANALSTQQPREIRKVLRRVDGTN